MVHLNVSAKSPVFLVRTQTQKDLREFWRKKKVYLSDMFSSSKFYHHYDTSLNLPLTKIQIWNSIKFLKSDSINRECKWTFTIFFILCHKLFHHTIKFNCFWNFFSNYLFCNKFWQYREVLNVTLCLRSKYKFGTKKVKVNIKH